MFLLRNLSRADGLPSQRHETMNKTTKQLLIDIANNWRTCQVDENYDPRFRQGVISTFEVCADELERVANNMSEPIDAKPKTLTELFGDPRKSVECFTQGFDPKSGGSSNG